MKRLIELKKNYFFSISNLVDQVARGIPSHASKLLLVGLAGVAWHNWRLWQRDKGRLLEKEHTPALPPLEWWPQLPVVSVLVAAWNESEHIERHIQSFLALRYPNKELILCAGGSDGTYQQARRYVGALVKVFEQQAGEGKQRALHRCFSHTRGTIIFLTDADCVLDNESLERTLYPVAVGSTQVCTGSSRPDEAQLNHPFVVAQFASQLYSDLYAPPYGEGLLGRNCAVTRSLLEQSRGLAAPAPTGTDYVLAKMLLRVGAEIRQVQKSSIVTDYPTEVGAYIRQQRRWVRNVALHGVRFRALADVKASLRSSLIGLMMLLLPLGGLLGRKEALHLWVLLLWHGFLSRVRYLYVVRSMLGITIQIKQLMLQPMMLFLDFIAWSQPLLDYLLPQRQKEW